MTFSNGSSVNVGWSLVYGPEGSVKYNGPLKSVKHKITGVFFPDLFAGFYWLKYGGLWAYCGKFSNIDYLI